MAKKLTREDEPSQKTGRGLEIPIPKKEEFEKLLKRAAKPKKDDRRSNTE